MDENLELIINNDRWTIVFCNQPTSWYATNTFTKTLYINHYSIIEAKIQTWMTHHEQYQEGYNG